jgi:hypothetical protein
MHFAYSALMPLALAVSCWPTVLFPNRRGGDDAAHRLEAPGPLVWSLSLPTRRWESLFVECGWTQARIAKRMGWSQQKVSLRLIFGRFLNYNGRCNRESPAELPTEWRFRDAWPRSGNENGPATSAGRMLIVG